jgi:hypothetical protein
VTAVLVDFCDGDLHRRVVFGFDDAVRGGAFAGDVAGGEGTQSAGFMVVWERYSNVLDIAAGGLGARSDRDLRMDGD